MTHILCFTTSSAVFLRVGSWHLPAECSFLQVPTGLPYFLIGNISEDSYTNPACLPSHCLFSGVRNRTSICGHLGRGRVFQLMGTVCVKLWKPSNPWELWGIPPRKGENFRWRLARVTAEEMQSRGQIWDAFLVVANTGNVTECWGSDRVIVQGLTCIF